MKLGTMVKKTLTVVLTMLVVAAVALSVYVMICTAKGKAAIIGGSCIVRVSTGSMQPSINVGDFILVREVSTDELHEGDIISFYSEDSEIYGKINTHRIIRRTPEGFVTMGDANSIEDETIVHDERIIGKYSGKLRYFRWLRSFRSAKKLMLLAVMALTLGISVYEVITISKIRTEIIEENEKTAKQEHEKMLREAIEEEKKRLRRENFQAKAPDASEDKSGTGGDEA